MDDKEKKEIITLCLDRKAIDAKYIDPKSIIVSEWVRYKCQYGCPDYGKCYGCPPYSPTPEITRKIIAAYSLALLVHFGGDVRVTKTIVEIEKEVFLRNYYKVISFGAGPCNLCKTCSENGCNFSQKVRPSMEACGIDVYQTVRNNGFPINVLTSKEEKENCYGLILIE